MENNFFELVLNDKKIPEPAINFFNDEDYS